jgi:hypothetical protein
MPQMRAVSVFAAPAKGQFIPQTDASASKNAAKCTKVRFDGPHRSILRWTRTTAMGRKWQLGFIAAP